MTWKLDVWVFGSWRKLGLGQIDQFSSFLVVISDHQKKNPTNSNNVINSKLNKADQGKRPSLLAHLRTEKNADESELASMPRQK